MPLEIGLAQAHCEQLERWLEELAQRSLIGQRVQELPGRDQQLLRELQQERGERDQVRELCHELARCPEPERELKLTAESRDS